MYLYDKKPKRKATYKKPRHFVLAGFCLLVAALVLLPLLFLHKDKSTPKPTSNNTQTNGTVAGDVSQAPPSFNKRKYSTADPASQWVVVNKKNPLSPKTYIPPTTTPNVPLRSGKGSSEMLLRPETARAVESLFAAAQQGGLNLMVASGYRSYQLQVSVYANEVKAYGQATADRESARPGYSEHQTGWSLDVEPASHKCEIADCFASTPEGQWLAANAYKYGFIIRYPQGKENVTGYRYEPWHIRYVGTELSQEMTNTSLETLEEFFDIPGGTNY